MCLCLLCRGEKNPSRENNFSKIYIYGLHNIRVYNEHACWQPQFVFWGTTLLAQSAANYPKLSPSHCSLITKIHSLFIPANYFFFLTLLHMTTRVPSLGTLTLEKAWSCQVLYLLPLFLSLARTTRKYSWTITASCKHLGDSQSDFVGGRNDSLF